MASSKLCALLLLTLNGVETKSIISKQIPVLSALQVSLLTRCAKICDFLSVSKCSLILVDKWRVVSLMQQALQPSQTNL